MDLTQILDGRENSSQDILLWNGLKYESYALRTWDILLWKNTTKGLTL